MSEIKATVGDAERQDPNEGPRLLERTKCERWHIPGSLRQPLMKRLSQIIHDETTPPRELLSAANAILAISKINMANIDLTIKVQKYDEMEKRMTAIERKLDARDARKRAGG